MRRFSALRESVGQWVAPSLPKNAVAAVWYATDRPFELQEFALPQRLREGELVVKLEAATVCGSDLHTVSGKREEPTPLVLGHEGVGVIERIGTDIFSGQRPRNASWYLREGDRVTFSVADSCGTCPQCTLHKLPQKCVSLLKYGHTKLWHGTGLNGTYATHIVLQRGTHVVPIPNMLTSRACAPLNCALATVANSLDPARMPRYGANNSAIVQGAGLLGIYAVAWLRHRVGVDRVFCFDMDEGRLETARKFGAIPVFVRDGEDEAQRREQLIRDVSPHGVDIVVEMSGARAVITEGVQLLRNGGHYAFCGMVHPDSQLSTLTGETIIRKCLTIRGAHNYTPWNLEEAVTFMQMYWTQLPFQSVISPSKFTLNEIEDAFAEAFSGRHCRVAIDCQAA